MAHTYAFAIGGAILLALTLTPVLASRGLDARARTTQEKDNWLMRGAATRLYTPLFDFALRRQKRGGRSSALVPIVAASALLAASSGGEFMPKLEEGNFWIRATLPTSISLEQSAKYVGRMRAILRGCPQGRRRRATDANRTHPEVVTVVSQLGRPDDGTDVSGLLQHRALRAARAVRRVAARA